MTNTEVNELIKLGRSWESLNPNQVDNEHKIFNIVCRYHEVPGGEGYYSNGSLKHVDTRSLFLMTLGVRAKLEEEYKDE